MMFSRIVLEAAKADAKAKYPQESCGVISKNAYIACTNVASNPTEDFQISSDITQPLIIAKTLQAVIHSHPTEKLKEPSCPSKADMSAQVTSGVTWGVIDLDKDKVCDPYFWGDFLLDEPLLGVEFHHGVNDCYSLIRKWYWQRRQIKLPEFPRDNLWWLTDRKDNLYMEGFEKAGFERIKKEDVQDGDVMMGKIRSEKINHAGIYLNNATDGKGLVLHHITNRLSRRESAYSYLNKAEVFLRYKGNAA